jgi:hypothetical protein
VQNDPANAVDPSGLRMCGAEYSYIECGGGAGFWGGNFGGDVAAYNRQYGGLPRNIAEALQAHDRRVANDRDGWGFAIGEDESSGGGQLIIPLFINLSPEKEGALWSALGAVMEALYNPSESCYNNVINPLAVKFGFGVAEFYNYLNQVATVYDGTSSLAPVAGIVTSTAAANAQYGPGASIASVFNQIRRDSATGPRLRTDALTSIITPTFTAFFRPSAIDSSGTSAGLTRNAGLLFHEALHGFGGTLGGTSYFDQELKSAFGLTGAGSNDISDYISRK